MLQGSNASRSPTGSSSSVNDNRWAKEDRSRFSTISESHRQQRPTTSAPGPHVDGRRERIRTNDPNTKKIHQDEKGSTDDSVDCGQETFVFERGGVLTTATLVVVVAVTVSSLTATPGVTP